MKKQITILSLVFILNILLVSAFSINTKIHPVITKNDGFTSELSYTYSEIKGGFRITYCHKDFLTNGKREEFKDIPIVKLGGDYLAPSKISADKECSSFEIYNAKEGDMIQIGLASTTIIFSSNDVEAVSMSPVNESSFTLAWCDETLNRLFYRFFSTNGSALSNEITVGADTTGCRNEGNPTSIAVFNNSKDITEQLVVNAHSHGTAQDFVDIHFLLVNGTIYSDKITVDDNSAGSVSGGVSIDVFNETELVVCWNDLGDADERTKCRMYNSTKNATSSEIIVSNSDASVHQDVGIAVMNESSFVVLHVVVNDLYFDSYTGATVVKDEVYIDTISDFDEFDVASLNSTHFVATYIDGTSIEYTVRTFDNETVLGNTVLDTVASGSENIELSAINSTAFAIAFTDNSPLSKKVFIGDIYGNTITPLTQYDDHNNEPVGVISQNNLFGFCLDTLVMTGGDNNQAFWVANHTDLTEWDGICIPPPVVDNPPDVTLITPLNDSTNVTNFNITFECSATDDINLVNISFYHNGSGTFEVNQTQSLTGLSDTGVFGVNFTENISIVWNCLAYDSNNTFDWGDENFTLNVSEVEVIFVDTTAPIVNLTYPQNNTNITSPVNFSYFVFDDVAVSNCSLFINLTLNITDLTITNNATNYFDSVIPLDNGTYLWNVECADTTDNRANSTIFTFNITAPVAIEDFLSLTQCPDTTGKALVLWLFIIISLAFIAIGIAFKIGFVGFFGSILLMITAWYISPCVSFFAYALGLLSLVLIIYFPTVHFIGFNNKTLKQ